MKKRKEVILAKTAGFCFGVKRAVDTALNALAEHGGEGRHIYTLGPIIHNEEVVADFKSKGIDILDEESIDDFLKYSGRKQR